MDGNTEAESLGRALAGRREVIIKEKDLKRFVAAEAFCKQMIANEYDSVKLASLLADWRKAYNDHSF
jgi:hypothetical protein